MRPRPAVLVVAALALSVGLVALDPNILTAVATAVLTIFAGLQIVSERAKRRSEERSADARLSVNAFALRKSISDWITRSRQTGWGDGPAKRAQEAVTHIESLRDRLEQGLIAAASPAAAAQMRTAYAHWQRALTKFESYLGEFQQASAAQLRGADANAFATLMSDTALLDDGRESLHACYLALASVVEPELAAEAKRLGAGPTI